LKNGADTGDLPPLKSVQF